MLLKRQGLDSWRKENTPLRSTKSDAADRPLHPWVICVQAPCIGSSHPPLAVALGRSGESSGLCFGRRGTLPDERPPQSKRVGDPEDAGFEGSLPRARGYFLRHRNATF